MRLHSPHSADWTLQIYRVQGGLHQQRVLSTFLELGWDGVTALGTQADSSWFIVVECSSHSLQVQAERVVMTMDPLAVLTYTTDAARLRSRQG
ncbi:hypothetical protein GEV29_01720 [Aeromicrobium sp. SMF47]|uniref:Uncharacterized protein n=1 Tax=Aeromicrobium yanjiei TaxID=2662028 RepID=A0A5Q2MK16_9ACTN|nr:hypothetical protein [Aeromicrobium yanjiei]MRJ75246.1 hypothetical protein [Aeromicrobium yanjiei]QGG40290.1 hypothetical protein GEV26_02285 [Aeromicrobium yanjiei]